ncbi:hypothetical protein Syun_019239 [Stephania yunnanensis]|uniref:Uncharacterized protein n=1 Tax=Stephania yunnanensis TaxID=152371 RepID=A0AAP0IVQ3_9MAGN
MCLEHPLSKYHGVLFLASSPCAMRQSIAFSLSDSDSELDDDESSQVALKLFFPFFLSNTFLNLQSALM